MVFCFKSILQIWIILIGFRDTNDFVNPGICKHEFKLTCSGYCRFTLSFGVNAVLDQLNVRDTYNLSRNDAYMRQLTLEQLENFF